MREQLKQALEILKRAEQNPEDRELFRTAVAQTLAVGVVTTTEAARGMHIPRPTLERWSSGASAPHHFFRLSVLRWLKEKAEEKLKEPLKKLLATIGRAEQNTRDDRLFEAVSGKALRAEVVTPREFARKYGMPLSTVERWRSGLSVAHVALRPRIYRWLKEKTEAKLKQ